MKKQISFTLLLTLFCSQTTFSIDNLLKNEMNIHCKKCCEQYKKEGDNNSSEARRLQIELCEAPLDKDKYNNAQHEYNSVPVACAKCIICVGRIVILHKIISTLTTMIG